MKLRGIEFGKILAASGVQGFFGEGYWFHPLFKPFGLDFSGVTFVSKTATLIPRQGNVKLTSDYKLRWPFPRCIRVKPVRGVMLNAVGLSNPGLEALLNERKWQQRTEPFFISIMSVAETPAKRLEELRVMTDMLGERKGEFKAPFGLQINLSCPNTGHDPAELIGESAQALDIAGQLGIPIMPKFSVASAPIKAVLKLQQHEHCDAICVSNTIPFGWERINWNYVWGSNESPLAYLGGGGLSGRELWIHVCAWIHRLRNIGFNKPINGGGGILCLNDVISYQYAGASSVFIGSVATLRPWRVRSIVHTAKRLRWRD